MSDSTEGGRPNVGFPEIPLAPDAAALQPASDMPEAREEHEREIRRLLTTISAEIHHLKWQASAMSPDAEVQSRIAVLAAHSEQLLGRRVLLFGHRLAERIDSGVNTFDTSLDNLTAKIDEFTTATGESSDKMERWTFWMMVSSFILASLTVAQIGIAIYQALHPDSPQILFVPR